MVDALIHMDRELAHRGLWAFTQIAWEHCQPSPLQPEWYMGAICDFLAEPSLLRVISVPPTTGKSTLSGVFWPAWVWTTDPQTAWQYVSYDIDLLNRDTEQLIKLVRSDWYVSRWGERLPKGKIGVSQFETLQGGGRMNTSLKAAATGWHCHRQVFDDPLKAADASATSGVELAKACDLIDDTFASRYIDMATFQRTIIGQRLADADPSGVAIERGWEHLMLPMLHESDRHDPRDRRTQEGESLSARRFPDEAVERLRRNIAPSTWQTQYQQNPSSKGGAIFDPEWLHAYDPLEARKRCWLFVQSWDLTFKGEDACDYVVGQWWGVGPPVPGLPGYEASMDLREPWFFELDEPVNEFLTFTGTLAAMRDRRARWRPTTRVYVEDKANGPAAEDVLKGDWPSLLELVTPKGGKAARAVGVTDLFAAHRVWFADTPTWRDRREVYRKFPRVRRDDLIDATTQALSKIRESSFLEALLNA